MYEKIYNYLNGSIVLNSHMCRSSSKYPLHYRSINGNILKGNLLNKRLIKELRIITFLTQHEIKDVLYQYFKKYWLNKIPNLDLDYYSCKHVDLSFLYLHYHPDEDLYKKYILLEKPKEIIKNDNKTYKEMWQELNKDRYRCSDCLWTSYSRGNYKKHIYNHHNKLLVGGIEYGINIKQTEILNDYF